MDIIDLLNQQEGLLIDYKCQWHTNQENEENQKNKNKTHELIIDLLALANADHPNPNRYLIIGILEPPKRINNQYYDETCDSKTKRKNTQNINNLLRKAGGAGLNRYFSVTVQECQLDDGHEYCIIHIMIDSSQRPYYLLPQNNESASNLCPYHIYTRSQDNNALATDTEVEKLYRGRFGIDKSPLERFIDYIFEEKSSWKQIPGSSDHSYYYKLFPEFTLNMVDLDDSEPWSRYPFLECFPAPNVTRHRLEVRYHSTLLKTMNVILVDDNYYLPVPKLNYEPNLKRWYYCLDNLDFWIGFFILDLMEDHGSPLPAPLMRMGLIDIFDSWEEMRELSGKYQDEFLQPKRFFVNEFRFQTDIETTKNVSRRKITDMIPKALKLVKSKTLYQ